MMEIKKKLPSTYNIYWKESLKGIFIDIRIKYRYLILYYKYLYLKI